jgi:hypothetical protein
MKKLEDCKEMIGMDGLTKNVQRLWKRRTGNTEV